MIEMSTALTDYLLAAAAILFGSRLIPAEEHRNWLWSIGFFVAAAAGIMGGTLHGFIPRQSLTYNSWQNNTFLLIGAAGGFLIAAGVSSRAKTKRTMLYFRAGILLTAAGAVLRGVGISLHSQFNHNDIYHCLQTLALYFVYRGALLSEGSLERHFVETSPIPSRYQRESQADFKDSSNEAA